MGPKIKQINRRLNELATEWNSFDLGPSRRETHSFVNSSDVIGRDKDKENIIDHLKEPSEDGNIPVIPIVGIGGLGKTTLVQLVYNDDRITELFPLKLWICVSEDFDLPRLLKLMILSVNKEENCDGLTVESLQTCLRSLLNDKKFLLVLDDVWNENRARWIELRDLLRSMDGLSQRRSL
ncbi:disease resistance protein RGA2-like [Hibiscus syriacus]|uniref:disease resistance protein RGA2-like n=1 Tax=Hibiscus syriacus TaxID=106335 RepID=UPI0019245B1E|nr:disease resistance protein RGA2-like [Hibiscus syriacus]